MTKNVLETELLTTKSDDTNSDFIEGRSGFLPIETNWFDRVFISVVIWVAISLFWFRIMEPLGLSIWISNIISLILAIIIVKKG